LTNKCVPKPMGVGRAEQGGAMDPPRFSYMIPLINKHSLFVKISHSHQPL